MFSLCSAISSDSLKDQLDDGKKYGIVITGVVIVTTYNAHKFSTFSLTYHVLAMFLYTVQYLAILLEHLKMNLMLEKGI